MNLTKKVQIIRETERISQEEKDKLQSIIDDKMVEMEKLNNEKTSNKLKIRELEKEVEDIKENNLDLLMKHLNRLGRVWGSVLLRSRFGLESS